MPRLPSSPPSTSSSTQASRSASLSGIAGAVAKQAADWGQHPKQHELDTIRRTGKPPFLPIRTRKHGALQQVGPAVLVDLAVAGQSPDELEERLRLAGRSRLPVDPPAGLAPDRVWAPRGNAQHLALAQRPHTVTQQDLDRAGQDLEALLLGRVVVHRWLLPTGRIGRLHLQQLALGVLGRLQEDQPLSRDRVQELVASVCHGIPPWPVSRRPTHSTTWTPSLLTVQVVGVCSMSGRAARWRPAPRCWASHRCRTTLPTGR